MASSAALSLQASYRERCQKEELLVFLEKNGEWFILIGEGSGGTGPPLLLPGGGPGLLQYFAVLTQHYNPQLTLQVFQNEYLSHRQSKFKVGGPNHYESGGGGGHIKTCKSWGPRPPPFLCLCLCNS